MRSKDPRTKAIVKAVMDSIHAADEKCGQHELGDLLSMMTGLVQEHVEKVLNIDDSHFTDALHCSVYNELLEAVEEVVEMTVEAWDEWEE